MFISYSSKDTDKRMALTELLKQNGVRYWYDKENLRVGSEWPYYLAEAIDESAGIIVLLSSNSVASTYVKKEITYAINHHKPVYTLMIEKVDLPKDVEFMLCGAHAIETTADYLDNLLASLPADVFQHGKKPAEKDNADYSRIRVGNLVDRKYLITEIIRSAKYFDAFRSIHKSSRQSFIAYVVYKNSFFDNYPCELFFLKSLYSLHIAEFVDFIDFEDYLMVVMRDCEGEYFGDYIVNHGPQSEEASIDFAKQICEAVLALNRSNVCRLIPDSFLIDREGTILLTDCVFGSAYNYMTDYDYTKAWRSSGGESFYISPEFKQRLKNSDGDILFMETTDIVYAIGSIMYAMVTGADPCKPPHAIYPIESKNPLLSDKLIKIIEKCRSRNGSDRYQSVEALLNALNSVKNKDGKKGLSGMIKKLIQNKR